MTWEDLADGRETVAKALTMRAGSDRLGRAMLADAADFAGEAARFRAMHEAGAVLLPALGAMLDIAPGDLP